MPTVRKSVIVPRSCEQMFALVENCERYPEFLPWCASAQVIERSEEFTVARLDIQYRGLKTHISTRNRKQAPHAIILNFLDGPFQRFIGYWKFTPLGDSGCKVELSMDYTFSSEALQALLGPVFGYISQTLVESFVKRAEQLEAGRAGSAS